MARHKASVYAALGCACAIVGAMAAPAGATPGWLAPIDVAEGTFKGSDSADVAMDARGDTLVVWEHHEGETSVLDEAWRPAGGSFDRPVTLASTTTPETAGYGIFAPVVAMDATGDATVAWITRTSPPPQVEAVACAPGGMCDAPTVLAIETTFDPPVAAMDERGDATVAWTWENGGFGEIQAASRPAGGAFERATTISNFSFGSAGSPTVAMDPAGDATVAWTMSAGSGPETPPLVQMSARPWGAAFSPPTGFSLQVLDPSIAMDARGDATAVWARYDPGHSTANVEVSTRSTLGGEFTQPKTVWTSPASSAAEAEAIRPKVVMDAAGETTIAWTSHEGVRTTTGPLGGPFGEIGGLNNPLVHEADPAIAVNGRGDAVAVWSVTSETGERSVGSISPAGGAFGTPAYLSYGSGSPSVAIDAEGDAAGAWIGSEEGHLAVQVAGYQADGPRLETLHAPTEGQAGSALGFSVAPLSVWSTIASTSWSWDDGSPDSSGTSVAHVFSTPGVYQVTVSATDALGNTTSAMRTVVVQATPATADPSGSQASPPRSIGSRSGRSTTPGTSPEARTALAPKFTPLFATKAAPGNGNVLGLLVGLPNVLGALAGDTILIRCAAGCQRPLHERVKIGRGGRVSVSILPPLQLYPTTRIEVELKAARRVTRYAEYRFIRTGRGVVAHTMRKGCLSATERPRSCT